MGKLMMTNHWPLEADTIIGEQKANIKESVRAWWATCQLADVLVNIARRAVASQKRFAGQRLQRRELAHDSVLDGNYADFTATFL
jgi:hypothetical protein